MRTSLQWALEFLRPKIGRRNLCPRTFHIFLAIDHRSQRRNTPPRSSSNATFRSSVRRNVVRDGEKKEFFDEKRHNTNFTADSTGHNGHPDTDVLTFCPLFNHFSFSPILPLHRTFAAPDSLFTYSPILSKKMDRSLLFTTAKNTSRPRVYAFIRPHSIMHDSVLIRLSTQLPLLFSSPRYPRIPFKLIINYF